MPLKMYEEPMSGVKQIVAIAAGKGGVGKSTVTVGLAHALVAMGFRVGILDADVYGPSIRKMVGDGELPYKEGDKLFPALSQGISGLAVPGTGPAGRVCHRHHHAYGLYGAAVEPAAHPAHAAVRPDFLQLDLPLRHPASRHRLAVWQAPRGGARAHRGQPLSKTVFAEVIC